DSTAETRAHYLFASNGINAEQIKHALAEVDIRPGFDIQLGLDVHSDNLEMFLQSHRDENILSAIQDNIRQSTHRFDQSVAQSLSIDWDAQLQAIFRQFGLIPPSADSASVNEEMNVTSSGASSSPIANRQPWSSSFSDHTKQKLIKKSDSSLTPKNQAWSKPSIGRLALGYSMNATAYSQPLVLELNASRLNNTDYPLAHRISETIRSIGTDQKSLQISEAWQIFYTMITHALSDSDADGARGTPECRRFAKIYANPKDNSVQIASLRSSLVAGALHYLEKQFFALIESQIAKQRAQAQLGGLPKPINKIKAYVNILFKRGDMWVVPHLEIINDIPIWAIIFYLLRSGMITEAMELTLENEFAFQKTDRSFPSYMKAYATSSDRRLPRVLNERLRSEFKQNLRFYKEGTSDPYKYAVYKLVGRADLSNKNIPDVLPTAEDWIWSHLMLTREVSHNTGMSMEEPLHEQYSLTDLQTTLLQFGARHFSANGQNNGLYLHLLLLTGQFERAAYYAHQQYPDDGVHFSIASYYYGLLRVSGIEQLSSEDILTLTPEDLPQISFARLMGLYTQDFRIEDPEMAVDYISLICLGGDVWPEQQNIAHEAIRELVLDTRAFAALLGDVQASGIRDPGILERKMKLFNIDDEEQFLLTITEQAATRTDEEGRYSDAILLYHLSEDYDSVVSLLNRLLGDLLASSELRSGSLIGGANGYGEPGHDMQLPMSIAASVNPGTLARDIMDLYETNKEIMSAVQAHTRDTCNMLLKIVSARENFEAGKYTQCIADMDSANLVPMLPMSGIVTRSGGGNGAINLVRKRAQQFGSLNEAITRNIPMILRMCMEALIEIKNAVSDTEFGKDPTRHKVIAEVQERAKNCMIYAGMIQYRMPQESYSYLTKLENAI
ncbi:hypothetical protein CANCADRAFT_19847, partial [Tortispora caseinolytica NRRL Y-17796]